MRSRTIATEHELMDMDRALTLVQGSFIAAAKLLDMTPSRFRNLVHWNPCLKEKWGRKRRGPGMKLPFHVEPYEPRKTCNGLAFAKYVIETELTSVEVSELTKWLQTIPATVPCDQPAAAPAT